MATELIKRPESLPDSIDKLRDFILIGQEALKAQEAKLRAIDKVGISKQARDSVLIDVQGLASNLLWAEAKMGELLAETVKARGNTSLGYQGRTKTLPPSITKKQSHYAQQLFKYPGIIQEVIEKSIKEEEIPRRNDVLKIIKSLNKSPKSDWLYIYNIWNLGKLEEDKDYFGAFPSIFMKNLLHYHTQENDLIYDPFAGSGTTMDICKEMNRQFYCSDLNIFYGRENEIKKWDIANGLPDDLEKPDFVFLDPPYSQQAKGQYSESPNDLGNMSLNDFNSVFNKFINLLMGWSINKIAIVIAPTQYPNEGHKFEDHIFGFHETLSNKYQIEMRYVLPYSTEQYNGNQVNIMKAEKKAINLIRDLIIWVLKKD